MSIPTILEEIIAAKKIDIDKFKSLSSIERFEKQGFFWQISNRSLVQGLLMPGSTGVIAEFKRKSPSKGWFKPNELEVESVIKKYNKSAAGISVLTNEEFFGGNLDDLIQTKMISDVAVLRKDFIVDRWQIAESKAFGADVILLIAACLSREQVKDFAGYAHELGLESILEIHTEKELDHYCDEVDMIGVNNRDLNSFKVDIQVSLDLIEKLPAGKPAIAESGITEVNVIKQLKAAGFKGFLIGERFMRENDPGTTFEEFMFNLATK